MNVVKVAVERIAQVEETVDSFSASVARINRRLQLSERYMEYNDGPDRISAK